MTTISGGGRKADRLNVIIRVNPPGDRVGLAVLHPKLIWWKIVIPSFYNSISNRIDNVLGSNVTRTWLSKDNCLAIILANSSFF